MNNNILRNYSRLTVSIFATALCTSHALADGKTTANPDISLILQAQYSDFKEDPENYELPGFMLGGEAGLDEAGFGLGHSELVISSNIDDLYFGRLTLALDEHDGETEVELEEGFIETLGLGAGITVKAGRFFSNTGYLNNQHAHMWDFIDAPLIYRGLFGNQLIDDGIQVRWLAPTDFFFQVGAEMGRGERFPASGAENDGRGTQAFFAEIGGDVGPSHSWQLGVSHWSADVLEREGGGHGHGHEEEGESEVASFSGTSDINAIDFVWKWAPNGNFKQKNLKFQFEYFVREEDGDIEMHGAEEEEESTYDGEQKGWYAQLTYQFTPNWRVGLRYDSVEVDNKGSDEEVLHEAGLDSEDHDPTRTSIMIDYAHSEFSLIRLQYNRDESSETSDDQIYLQYVMSLGAHGAHQF